MEKFEAGKLFLKMLTEYTQDFTVKSDSDGRNESYFIQHIRTGTRVLISVSGKPHCYIADSETDLNYVDSETATALAIFARDYLEKQREQALISKDNKLVYNITALYA